MLGARPFALAEDPVLRSGADKIAAKLGVRPPQLYLIDDGFPRLFAVGRGPVELDARGLDRCAPVAPPRGARGGDRARARARPPARRARADVRRPLRDDARRDRAGSAAGSRAFLLYVFAPIGAAFVHVLLSPKRELARRRARGERDRRSARPRRRADAPRPRGRARRVRRVAGDGAALPDRSVRDRRRRTDVQDTPAARRSRASAPRARRRLERPRARRHSRSSPGSSENITESRIRPSGCRRCARRTPSRWKPTFSATRCDATLSGSVTRSTRWSSSSSSAWRESEAQRARADALPARTPRRSSTRSSRDSRASSGPSRSRRRRARRASIARALVLGSNLATNERTRILLGVRDAESSESSARPRGRCSRRRAPSTSSSVHGRSTRSPSRSSTRRSLGKDSRDEGVLGLPRKSRRSERLCTFARSGIRARGFLICAKTGRRPTLPGACAPSTIGAGGLNFSVRNGKRCIPAAMTAQVVEVPRSRLSRARERR